MGKKLTAQTAFDKLTSALQAVEQRGDFKAVEKKRITHALGLLRTGQAGPSCYLEFLICVRRTCGYEAVILCAAGLGIAAITRMGEKSRVDLLQRLRGREELMRNEHLSTLTNTYIRDVPSACRCEAACENLVSDTRVRDSNTPIKRSDTPVKGPDPGVTEEVPGQTSSSTLLSTIPPFTEDVWELDVTDLWTVVSSGSNLGQVLLIDRHQSHMRSFVSIQISDQLFYHLMERPRRLKVRRTLQRDYL